MAYVDDFTQGNQTSLTQPRWGKRPDGTEKGDGWLGPITMDDGRTMTEQSVGVEFDGWEGDIPTLVSGLSDEHIQYLKEGNDPRDNEEIMKIAVNHARVRVAAGQNPFKEAASFTDSLSVDNLVQQDTAKGDPAAPVADGHALTVDDLVQQDAAKRDPATPITGDPAAPVADVPALTVDGLVELDSMARQLGREIKPGDKVAPGFFEGIAEGGFAKKIPFVSGWIEAKEMYDMYQAAQRIESGEDTEEDQHLILDWFLKQQVKEYQQRGIRSNAGSIVGQSLPFMLEFMATQGTFAVGKQAARATILSALKKVTAGTARSMVRKAVPGAAGVATQTAAMGALGGRFRAGAYRNMLPELGLDYDDEQGYHAIVTAPGRPETEAWFRSVVDYLIEVSSERSGWVLARGVSTPFNAVAKRSAHVNSFKNSIVGIYSRIKKITGKPLIKRINELLKQGGWNGVLGEVFEEKVGAGARLGFDFMTGEEIVYEWESIAERLGWTKEQLYTEFLAFSAVSGGMYAPAVTITGVQEHRRGKREKEKGEETVAMLEKAEEEFEIEQGARSTLGDIAVERKEDEPQNVINIKKDGEVRATIPIESKSAEAAALDALSELAEESGWELEPSETKVTVSLFETTETGGKRLERQEDATVENFEAIKAEFDEVAETSDDLEVVVKRPLEEERKDVFKFRGAEREEDNVEETIGQIEAKERERTGSEDVTVEVVPESEHSGVMSRIASTLKNRGLSVVVIRGSKGKMKTPGAYKNNTVYVQDIGTFEESEESKEAARELFLGILAHELTHNLEKESPDLYKWLVKNMPRRFARGIQQYEGATGEKLSLQDAFSEGGAVLVQELVNTIGGKKILNMEDRGMLEKFIDWIRYHSTRLNLRGKKLQELQEVIEQMLTGPAIEEEEAAPAEEAAAPVEAAPVEAAKIDRTMNEGQSYKGVPVDNLFDDAVRIMIESGRGSVSLLQRRMGIGYGRASRIIDQMEATGIVGKHRGSVAREILMSLADYEAQIKTEEEAAPAEPKFAAVRARRREEDPLFAAAPPNKSNDTVRENASSYMSEAGLPYEDVRGDYAELDPGISMDIADAYEAVVHDPQDPATAEAYQSLISETLAQYDHLVKRGVKLVPTSRDPYKNSADMVADIRDNNRLYYFKTEEDMGDHPLNVLVNRPVSDESGKTYNQKANDIFRAVHDYFGHAKEGYGFSARGEENAWRAHSSMYSQSARRALTTETRGQNSWVNSNRNMRVANKLIRVGEVGYVAPSQRPFAEQKAGLLPDRFVDVSAGELATAPLFAATPREVANKFDSAADRERDLLDDVDYQELVDRGVQEVTEAMDGESELGRGWYTKDFRRAVWIGSLIVPSIKKSKKNIKLFIALLAITSPGNKLFLNYKNAIRAFQYYVKTGAVGHKREHNVRPGGAASKNILKALEQLDRMVQDMGIDAATDWLFKKHTGYELRDMRRKYGVYKGGNAALTREHYGIRMFGPKVGPFGLNFAGVSSEVTIDVWASRTIARWMGVLGKKSRFFESKKGIVENVKNDKVRNTSKQLFRDIAARVGMEPHDVQAVLWYHEKRLFASEGYGAAGADINLTSSAKQLARQDLGEQYEEGKIETEFKREIRLADRASARREREPSGRLRERDTTKPQFAAAPRAIAAEQLGGGTRGSDAKSDVAPNEYRLFHFSGESRTESGLTLEHAGTAVDRTADRHVGVHFYVSGRVPEWVVYGASPVLHKIKTKLKMLRFGTDVSDRMWTEAGGLLEERGFAPRDRDARFQLYLDLATENGFDAVEHVSKNQVMALRDISPGDVLTSEVPPREQQDKWQAGEGSLAWEAPKFAAAPRGRAEDPRGIAPLISAARDAMSSDEWAEDIANVHEPLFAVAPPRNSKEYDELMKDAYVRDYIYHGTVAGKMFWTFLTDSEMGAHFGTRGAGLDRIQQHELLGFYDEIDKYARIYKAITTIKRPFIMSDVGEWNVTKAMSGIEENAEFNEMEWGQGALHYDAVGGKARFNKLVQSLSQKMTDVGRETFEWFEANKEGMLLLQEWLQSNGYDSIEYSNNVEDRGSTSFIVFRSKDIYTVNASKLELDHGDIVETGEVWTEGGEVQPQFAAAPREEAEKKAKSTRTARQLAKDMYNKWLLKHKAKEDALEERRDALKIVINSLEKAFRNKLPESLRRLELDKIRTEAALQKAIAQVDKYVKKAERSESASKFKKVIKKLNPKRFDPAYWKMITDIIGDIDISKPTKKTKENLAKIASFILDVKNNPEKYDEGYATQIEMFEALHQKALSRLGKKALADMSKEEIDEAISAIELIRSLNRINNELILHQKRVKRVDAIIGVTNELAETSEGTLSYTKARGKGVRGGTVKPWGAAARVWDALVGFTGLKLSQALQPDAMAHLISGSPNSTTWEILYGSVDAAYSSMLKDYYESRDYLVNVLRGVGVDTSTKEGRDILRSMSQGASGRPSEWKAGEGPLGLPGRVEKLVAKVIDVPLADGRKIKLTEAELIDLLAHFQDMSTIKQIVENNSPVKLDITTTGKENEIDLSIEDVVAIIMFAEKEHSRAVTIADAMVTYANGPLAQLMERWSVDTYGYSNVSGDTWWSRPRQRSKEEVGSIKDGELAIESMRRAGLVKERGDAKSPILVKDAFVKFSNMSWTISGIANLDPVITSARSVLNSDEVKGFLETHKHGRDIRNYWKELYGEIATQVVGGQPDAGDAGGAMKWFANTFTKGTLAVNPRVAAYQMVSVATASSEMPGHYLAPATGEMVASASSRRDVDELMDQHSPYLRFRFDSSAFGLVNAVSSTGVSMYGIPPKGEWGMWAIGAMDKMAIRTIWRATEAWVGADIRSGKLSGVTENSQEFYEEVARRTERVVKRTQPTMDPVHSSGLTKEARKGRGLARILTMFMSQRNKNFNMVARSLLKNKGEGVSYEAIKPLIATLVYQPTGLILINYVYEVVLRGGLAAFWGDDEGERKLEELTTKTFSKTVLNDYLSINLGNLPIGSYLSDAVVNIGVDVGLLEEDDSMFKPSLPMIGNLVNTLSGFKGAGGELLKDEDEFDSETFWKHVKRSALGTGRAVGWQLTPVLSQALQAYDSYFVEPDYTKMFTARKKELKDAHISETTPEEKRELKRMEDYWSYEKVGNLRKVITKVKKEIKDEQHLLGFETRNQEKQKKSRARVKALKVRLEKLEESLNALMERFITSSKK